MMMIALGGPAGQRAHVDGR